MSRSRVIGAGVTDNNYETDLSNFSTWLVEIDPRLPGLTGDGGRLPCIREGSGKDPSVK